MDALIEESRELSYKNFGRGINFYYTSDFFPAVSVTSSSCALNCKHCGRRLIERLTPALTPKELVNLCVRFHRNGSTGVLLTGGCTPEGKVPLSPFLDAVRRIKDETGMLVIAHTGVINRREARDLKDSGLDGVCVDVVGSEETTKEIYGIELYPEDYRRTLKALQRAGVKNIAPHICVGLHHGRLFHEYSALDIISSIKPSNIVVIGLTNIIGTQMEDVRINAIDVVEVLCKARLRFPESFVSLGCARGKGDVRAEIDRLAVRAGVNSIAVPTPTAYMEAEKFGLGVREFHACCALLPEQLQ
ncbi:MAG: radical SAM protein [Candidatus Altiarchaeota archaeon]|nr:radical SAM protein [Candidatus Altiarchaeota archaeon]